MLIPEAMADFKKYHCQHTVSELLAVAHNRLDDAALLELLESSASDRATDLHPIDENRDGNKFVRRDILD